jgi:uncharacterized protein
MKSCIYAGHVRHRRFSPVKNAFRYGLFLMYLDLAELPRVFKGRWFWSAGRFNLACFRRPDHFGDPAVPLDRAVRDLVQEKTGQRPSGPIRMLAHLRYFGHCFNPASFFYCYDAEDRRVETIVVEIHNTPWGEVFCYVLAEARNQAGGNRKRYQFAKDFHVSPFMDMDLQYDWRFVEPGESLNVHMNVLRTGEKLFDATLTLKRREITPARLFYVLVRYPLMTVKVVFAIYWQALRLRHKGAKYYPHPEKRVPAREEPPK